MEYRYLVNGEERELTEEEKKLLAERFLKKLGYQKWEEIIKNKENPDIEMPSSCDKIDGKYKTR